MKQYCIKGHNTYSTGRGKRGHCKICLREAHKLYMTKRKPKNPRFAQDYEWKRRKIMVDGHFFTLTDYNRAYQVQGGHCGMCEKHQANLGSVLVVDHDHKTGLFRGLLCRMCNIRLGHYEKSKERAEIYLHKDIKRVSIFRL